MSNDIPTSVRIVQVNYFIVMSSVYIFGIYVKK